MGAKIYKINETELVQIGSILPWFESIAPKMHFFSEKCPKRVFLAFLKLLGDVVGEECLSPAEAYLPLSFPIGIPELTP